ncbi:unnamed protein product [Prunus brigantina]
MACPTFSSTTPHFFKIILDNTSRDRKLRIPEKFVMEYGDGLSNPMYLKLPSEVYYPLTMPQMEETQCADDSRDGFRDVSFEDSDENSVEMFNFPPCPRKTREKSTLP